MNNIPEFSIPVYKNNALLDAWLEVCDDLLVDIDKARKGDLVGINIPLKTHPAGITETPITEGIFMTSNGLQSLGWDDMDETTRMKFSKLAMEYANIFFDNKWSFYWWVETTIGEIDDDEFPMVINVSLGKHIGVASRGVADYKSVEVTSNRAQSEINRNIIVVQGENKTSHDRMKVKKIENTEFYSLLELQRDLFKRLNVSWGHINLR